MGTRVLRVLLLGLLVALASCQDCAYPYLPDSLNSEAFVAGGGLHEATFFRTDFSVPEQFTTFSVTEESYLRLYTAPHDVSVSLTLLDGAGQVAAVGVGGHGLEQTLFTTVITGSYSIKWSYQAVEDLEDRDCDSVYAEIAIVPKSSLPDTVEQYQCPAVADLPVDDPFAAFDPQNGLHYEGNFVAFPQTIDDGSMVADFFWATTFSVSGDTHDVWHLTVSVEFDFLTSGSLGALLGSADQMDPPSLFCQYTGCVVAVGAQMNKKVLDVHLDAGTYTLNLFDAVSSHDMELLACSEFYLTIDVQPVSPLENGINCQAQWLPDTLNRPGFITQDGFLQFVGPMFLDFTRGRSLITTFTIVEESLFRVVVEESDVNVDLFLYDGSGDELAYSNNWNGAEEGILLTLHSGTYTLEFNHPEALEYEFCRTWDVVIALAPSASLSTYCSSLTGYLPDLSGVQAALDSEAEGFTLAPMPHDPYEFYYQGNYNQQQILVSNFHVDRQSYFVAEVGMNFLIGDISIRLVSALETRYSDHYANVAILKTVLEPGDYSFVILTGVTQSDIGDAEAFSSCALFTLAMAIEPVEEFALGECIRYPRIPESLNSPSFLGSMQWVYIDSDFQGPREGEYKNLEFDVKQSSYLRVRVDFAEGMGTIDLFQGDVLLVSDSQGYPAKEIDYVVDQNLEYVLRFSSPSGDVCSPVHMELGLTPIHSDDEDGDCLTNQPRPDLFFYDSLPVTNEGTFSILQPQAPADYNWSVAFDVYEEVFVRISISQDFLSSNITMYLWAENGLLPSQDETTRLYPGSYTLELHEDGAEEYLHQCAFYFLSVSLSSTVPDSELLDAVDCGIVSYLPNTLDTVGYLSVLSGEQTHFNTAFLVDVEQQYSETVFTVTDDYVFAVYVAPTADVNIGISVVNSTYSLLGFSDATAGGQEYFYATLAADTYTFITQYYPPAENPFPGPQDCAEFTMELALTEQAVVDALLSVDSQCVPTSPPGTLVASGDRLSIAGDYQHVRDSGNPVAATVAISVTSPTYVYVAMDYNFRVGAMAMRIEANFGAEEVLYAITSIDSAFIEINLLAGDYSLIIEDLSSGGAPGGTCVNYRLDIKFGSRDASVCTNLRQLPTDLFSPEGGSEAYGGPQNPDTGRVLVGGAHFSFPAAHTSHTIAFHVPEESFNRIFLDAGDDNTVVITLYTDAEKTDAVEPTIALEHAWHLMPQSGPFYLELFFAEVDYTEACGTFSFQIEQKPLEDVTGELDCPVEMPNPVTPPSAITLAGEAIIFGDYLYDSDSLDTSHHLSYGGVSYTYFPMEVQVTAGGLLHVYVEYDMLVGDIRLLLGTGSNRLIGFGDYQLVTNHAGYFNMRNGFVKDLSDRVGETLTLYFLQSAQYHPVSIDHFCVPFEFSLTYTQADGPHVMFVDPPGGNDFNPLENFVVSLIMSDSVGYPAQSELLSFCEEHDLIAMELVDDVASRIHPSSIQYVDDSRVIVALFRYDLLVYSGTYNLHYNASALLTEEGVPFTGESNGSEVYGFRGCSCNGHGVCSVTNGEFSCDCDAAYSGDQCENCNSGYHPANSECIANSVCEDDTCNYHGTCKDSHGYFHCSCDDGWATTGDVWCSVCAHGYILQDGDCVEESDGADHPVDCDAPLLPLSFDSLQHMGYNGIMHVVGDYFADPAKDSHTVTMNLATGSSFRAAVVGSLSVELWSVGETYGEVLVASASVNPGWTQTVAYQVEDADYAGAFELRLAFASIDIIEGDICNTIHLEAQSITAEDLSGAHVCTSHEDMLPMQDLGEFVNITDVFHYTPEQTFTISAATEDPYFYVTSFSVEGIDTDLAPLVTIEVGYQFIQGEVMPIIERAGCEDCGNHCNSAAAGLEDNCVWSESLFNKHILEATVVPGETYNLWLYSAGEVLPAISDCTEFTFSMEVSSVPAQETMWTCSLPEPPAQLSELYTNDDGYVHLVGLYHIPAGGAVVDLGSWPTSRAVRVMVETTMPAQTLTLWVDYEGAGDFTVISGGAQGFTAHVLDSGANYAIKVTSDDASAVGTSPVSCNEVVIEIEAAAVQEEYPCQNSFETLPFIRPEDVGVGYSSGIPSDFVPAMVYTFIGPLAGDVYSFNFELSETAVFSLGIASDFLTASVGADLYRDNYLLASSISYYNFHLLLEVLQPGTYSVVAYVQPPLLDLDIRCADFTFELSVMSAQECALAAEPIPRSFNSLRYLSSDTSFQYLSNAVAAPLLSGNTASTTMTSFFAYSPSIFRVYANSFGAMDMDVNVLVWDNGTYVTQAASQADDASGPHMVSFEMAAETSYMLQLSFTANAHTPLCPSFMMEVAIEQVESVDVVPYCPNHSSGHFNPTFPHGLPEATFYYDSEELGEDLFYQQAEGYVILHHNSFSFDAPGNLHAEVGYDFLSSDVNLVLRSTDDQGLVVNGFLTFNRATIHAVNVPPGSYALYVYQAQLNPASIQGCTFFTLKIVIEPTSGASLASLQGAYPPLPSTLGSIGYLGYDGRLAFSTSTVLPWQQASLLVPVEEDSYMRLLGFNSAQEGVTFTFLTEESEIIASADEELFLTLEGGATYVLIITTHDATAEYTFEMSFDTVSRVDADMDSFTESLPSCPTTSLPPATFTGSSSSGYYYSNLQATIGSSTTTQAVTATSVTLQEEAYLYVHIGFQFLIGDLWVVISSENNPNFQVHSMSGLNHAELYYLLPAGFYTLTIEQSMASNLVLPNHCGGYSIVMAITSQGGRPDCYDYLSLPVDLDTPYGGSALYGGPLDDTGALSFYGPSFAYSDIPQHVSHVQVQLTDDSVVSVFTNSHVTATEKVDFSLFGNNAYVAPLLTKSPVSGGPFQQRVFSALGTDRYFDIRLYDGIPLTDDSSCPTYALDVQIESVEALNGRLSCLGNLVMPAASPAIVDGVGYDLVQSTYRYSALTVPYEVSFTVEESSVVVAVLSFDALLASVDLTLMAGVARDPIAFSTLYPDTADGAINLSASIRASVDAGIYAISISGSGFDEVLDIDYSSGAEGSCFPYAWSLQVFPDTENPYVVSLNPSSEASWPIGANLVLTVTFSTSVYANGLPLSNLNKGAMFEALYLRNGETFVSPSSCFSVGVSHTVWQLVFPADELVAGATYLFGLHSGIVTDRNFLAVEVPGTYAYSVRVDCSLPHQHYTVDFACECDTGYAGASCDFCDTDYFGYPSCVPDVCESCEHGYCSSAVCHCDHGYTGDACDACATNFIGDNCELCASHYEGYDCDQCKPPYAPSLDGACNACQANYDPASGCQYCLLGYDLDSGCTECEGHFTGDECDGCEHGWAGTQCDRCGDHFATPDCGSCATNWYGDDCELCPSNFQESPGNCALCAFNWDGDNCDQCADGFAGDDCTVPDVSTGADSSSSERHTSSSAHDTSSSGHDSDDSQEDNFILGTEWTIVALLLIVGLLLVAAIVIALFLLRKQRKRSRQSGPVLDLDEDDAVELETNPMAPYADDDGELLQFSWGGGDSSNMNTVGEFDSGVSLDDEFEGALDLENLDSFSPQLEEEGLAEPAFGPGDDFLDDDFNPRM